MCTKNKYTKGCFHKVAFGIFLFLFFNSHLVSARINSGDSTKVNFSLNDPRNPNCPCHKYQKMADDEFAILQGVSSKDSVAEQSNQQITHATSSTSVSSNKTRRTFISKIKYKFTRNTQHVIKRNKGKHKKHFSFLKRVKDPSKCYHWR